MRKTVITQERLLQLVSYNPETGVFTWIGSASNKWLNCRPAGCCNAMGYIVIRLDGVLYQAHRLAWLAVHGIWPAGVVDHLNGVRDENGIANLRHIAQGHNLQNREVASRRNSTGLLGVSRSKRRFKASISIDGKQRHIGSFATEEQAHAAYLEEKKQMHPFFNRGLANA